MNRSTGLFIGIAALALIGTVAEAADGCGRFLSVAVHNHYKRLNHQTKHNTSSSRSQTSC
jgi:ATP-dependent protease Clp ATPase subunit